MKINLFNKPGIPVIAFLCERSLQLNIFLNGQFKLKRYDLDYNELRSDSKISLDIPAKSKVIIILADELLLYSQQKLPGNLTHQEVIELIAAHISQHQADSAIQTYYDYFQLQRQDNSVVYGVFEARKDELERIIQLFESAGSKVSLLIPELLVIVNQVLHMQTQHFDNYYLVIGMNRAITIVEVNNHQLAAVNQIHSNQDRCDSAYIDLDVYLSEVQANHVIMVGLDLIEFKNQSHYYTDKSIKLESIDVNQDLGLQCMHWMREQYDLYQSVALA